MSTIKTPSQLAEEARQTASDAIDSTRAYAQNAVNAAGEKVRDLRREAEPTVEQRPRPAPPLTGSRCDRPLHRRPAGAVGAHRRRGRRCHHRADRAREPPQPGRLLI
jgi:hypothetical protein